jgi:intein/homing endonuclease
MAGQFLDFWRIVKPTAPKSGYVNSNPDDYSLFSNFSWYNRVMKGSGSRFSKYQQFKNMDADVFVARALDTIAEEMSSTNIKTNLPFDIEYQNEVDKDMPEHITMTVRAALRHWCDLHELDNRLFDVARIMIKYGDCFFRKHSDLRAWEYIEPQDVIGVSIDKKTNKVLFYQLKKGGSSDKSGSVGEIEIIPAAGMIHFSLSSGFDENAPFGDSVLFPTIKAFRHLSLLEDAVIIYRIVRAPERRVFMIDVGNMPPQRARAYLESVKTEIRQKRIPSDVGGQEKIDSVYSPQSMCLTLDTRIPLLDGRVLELNELIAEHEAGKKNWVYSVDPMSGKVVPGPISWAGVTRKSAELVKIVLDNGETLTCTPDHMIPLKSGTYVRADQLMPGSSLISFERKLDKPNQVLDHFSNQWVFAHELLEDRNKLISALTHERKLVSVEKLNYVEDTGCITVDKDGTFHNFHNFAIESGIFVKNSEDFFFAQGADGRGSKVETLPGGACLALNTKIKLLDGRDLELQSIIQEQAEGKENWVYSCDPFTGKFAPGKITWAGVTRKNTQVIKLTFDNGESVTVTPDHKFPIKGIGFIEAQNLCVGQSMIPHYTKRQPLSTNPNTKYSKEYEYLYQNDLQKWEATHRLVAKYLRGTQYEASMKHNPDHAENLTTIHHLNFDRFNNSPSNLVWMGPKDHWAYHSSLQHIPTAAAAARKRWLKENDPAEYARIGALQGEATRKWRASLSDLECLTYSKSVSVGIKKYFSTLDEPSRERRDQTAIANFLLGSESLLRKLEDPIYNKEFGKKISEGQAKIKDSQVWKERNVKISNSNNSRSAEFWKINGKLSKEAYAAWKLEFPEEHALRSKRISEARTVKYDNIILEIIKTTVKINSSKFPKLSSIINDIGNNIEFTTRFKDLNANKAIIFKSTLLSILQQEGFKGWKDFRNSVSYANHKIVSIEWLAESQDTGTISVDGTEELHDYHTFALSCGVYTKNSIGEIDDLKYFQSKFLQGLRIPASYMRGSADGGSQTTDGKVGIAYIEELRFANYVKRLQQGLNKIFDAQFKAYMKSAGLNIDSDIFKLKLIDPQNFQVYKQAEVDDKLISNFNNLKEIKWMSPRHLMKTILNWSEDEIKANEVQRKQELGIPEGGYGGLTELRMLYDPEWLDKPPEIKVADTFNDFTKDTTIAGAEKEEEPPEDDKDSKDSKDGKNTPEDDGSDPDGLPDKEDVKPKDEPPSLDDLDKDIKK